MATALDVQHERPVPPQIAALGHPLQAHRQLRSRAALVVILTGVFFLLAAGLCVVTYMKVPIENDVVPQETMLNIAGGVALLGSALFFGGWRKGGLRTRRPRWTYFVYPQALVQLDDEVASVIRWDDITELHSPKNLGDYRITTKDGRTFPIRHGVQDHTGLIASVVQNVQEQVLSPAKQAVDAGQKVTFGPFEVSREAISYKGKTLSWDQVAALEVQIGRAGRRLRIRRSGALLPWCYANLASFPNGVLLPELLNYVCPDRLLR